MRIVDGTEIVSAVRRLFIDINYEPESLCGVRFDDDSMGDFERSLAAVLHENIEKSASERRPLCQDCGVAQLFVKVGKNFSFSGAPSLETLLNRGVEEAYRDGLLRKSTVCDPFDRVNGGKNLPAFIHWELCDGDKLEIYGIAKGGGSENVSNIKMMAPAAGRDGVADFVVETLKKAGGKGCPPYFVGVGVGGTFDSVGALAKSALLERNNDDDELAGLIMSGVSGLGFGILGFPGVMPVKGLFIKKAPTHIAMLPVAVALNCHSFRVGKVIL